VKNVGQLLKEARIQKNLSIQDIAFALKISARTLAAIEESDEKELPARAFVRGFAKSYAKYLKLESEDFNTAFQSEFADPEQKRNIVAAAAAPHMAKPTPTATEENKSNPSSAGEATKKIEVEDELSQLNHEGSKTTLIYGASALALVIAIGVAQRVIEKYQKETLVAESSQPTAATPLTTEESKKPEALNEKTSPPVATSEATSSTPSAGMSTGGAPMSTVPSSSNTTPVHSEASKPATTTIETKKESETPAAAVVKKADPKIDVTSSVYKLASVEVVIEALGDIEVEYSSKSDGKGKLKLAKGQLHIFKSKNGLRLSINDGGLAKLAVNGKDVGVAGASGKSVSITY